MQAFVAMPFNPNFYPIWKVIKKACDHNDISAVRVDQLPLVEDIQKTICNEIDISELVIVDFSGDKQINIPNPNVVTEAKHAKDQKKPLIILTQSTEALPFDWRVHRAIIYKNDTDGLLLLENILCENLQSIKSRLCVELAPTIQAEQNNPLIQKISDKPAILKWKENIIEIYTAFTPTYSYRCTETEVLVNGTKIGKAGDNSASDKIVGQFIDITSKRYASIDVEITEPNPDPNRKLSNYVVKIDNVVTHQGQVENFRIKNTTGCLVFFLIFPIIEYFIRY